MGERSSVHDGSFFVKADPKHPACGKWGREQIQVLKAAALSSKTVYAYCYVQPYAFGFYAVAGWLLVIISIIIQIVIPLGIIVLLQPVDDLEGTTVEKVCPRRSNGLTKILAFTLSAYFVVLTLGLCTNKLRGLAFLRDFVHVSAETAGQDLAAAEMRKVYVHFGILSQCLAIFVASLAQYLLFIGNGDNYVVLLLQSLAMQFCLTVDQNIVNHQLGGWTTDRLKVMTKDEFLATDYGGLGGGDDDPDGTMPATTLKCIVSLVNSEKIALVVFVTIGVFWSTCLAVCM